jgi:hypothetical protein
VPLPATVSNVAPRAHIAAPTLLPLSHTALPLTYSKVLSMPIEDVLVLNVDDGRVTVAGACLQL